MTTDHRTVVEFVDDGARRMHKTSQVRINGSPVTVAADSIFVSQPNKDLRVTLTLLPDELHYVHDAETPPPATPAAPVAAQEPDQAPVGTQGDDRRHTATTTDILDKDLRSALGRKAQRAARASQDATGPQEGAGRIGWLRLRPGAERRYLMREAPGGWADTDDDDLAWPAEEWPDAVFEPIRTLADDEVAVKREDLCAAIEHLTDGDSDTDPSAPFLVRLRAALEAGEDRG